MLVSVMTINGIVKHSLYIRFMCTSSLVSVIIIVVVYFFLSGFILLHQVTSITCVINF